MFSCEICHFFKNTYFEEHLLMIAFANVSIWNYWVDFPPQNSECQEVAHKPLTRSHNVSQIVLGQTNFLKI